MNVLFKKVFSKFHRYVFRFQIRLKKNVVSVDYHVAQYAKIVEDLKLEILSLQNKIAALEEENQALMNQVNNYTYSSAESGQCFGSNRF